MTTLMPKQGITRRSFLKTTGLAAGAAALGGTCLLSADALAQEEGGQADKEELHYVICRSNCFQACLLNGHVRDGKLVKMSRADYPEEIYSGCCLRGLTLHERVYSKTRIKYPLRRAEGAERGSDQWERITWDEAIDEVAQRIKEIQDAHGKRAIALESASGNYGVVQAGAQVRFAGIIGATKTAICYDQAFGYGADRVVGGYPWAYNNEPKTMLDAKNIIVWGANPVFSQPQTWRIARRAQEAGATLTCIDPIYSATAARCDRYIWTAPGSDLPIALAILNEIASNDLIDEEYVKAHTTAPFLLREDTGLILRRSDVEGGPMAQVRDAATLSATGSMHEDPAYVWDEKADAPASFETCTTPALEGEFEVGGIKVQTVYTALKRHVSSYTIPWASELSGMSEEDIRSLVDIYASKEPVFLYSIYGIDHYRNGHIFGQAMAIVHALTNNLSREGSSLGGLGATTGSTTPIGTNPLLFVSLLSKETSYGNIPTCDFANVLATGKHKGQDWPIKGLIVATANPMSNWADQNRYLEDVVGKLDFIVTLDTEMTDTARYSDYVLPVSFWVEGHDVRGNFSNPYVAYGDKCIDPLYETKFDSEIYALLAEKLGLAEMFPLQDTKDWVDVALDSDTLRNLGITQTTLRSKGGIRCVGSVETPQIIGYQGAPLPTPSERAELYCEFPLPRIDYGQQWQEQAMEERFPTFVPPTENWRDSELKAKYPLSYLQLHERGRTHTQWFAVETLREIDREPYVYLSPQDAEERGIADGDVVEVFNDRGHVVVKAVVSDAFSPGVVSIPKGWQRNQFIEGCFQELTGAEADPLSVNFAYYDTLVDVRKR